MWEFEVMHRKTKERIIIFGYNLADAYKRSKLNSEEYICLLETYID